MGLLKATKVAETVGREDLARAEALLAQRIAEAAARVEALEAPDQAVPVEDLVRDILSGTRRDEDRARELEAARREVAALEADRERLRGARAGIAAREVVEAAEGLRATVGATIGRLAEALAGAAAAQREAAGVADQVQTLLNTFTTVDAIVDRTGSGPRLRFPIDPEVVGLLRTFREFVDEPPNASRYSAWVTRGRQAGWVK